jgi:hypothetical protein
MTIAADGSFTVDIVPVEVFAGYKSPFWNAHIETEWNGAVDWARAIPVTGSIRVEEGYISVSVDESQFVDAIGLIFDWGGGSQIAFPVGPVDGEPFVFQRVAE